MGFRGFLSELMASENIKKNLMRLTILLVLLIALSYFFGIPYIFSLIGLAIWAAFGHLITLDDDRPDGWSNIEGTDEFYKQSKWELRIKFAFLLLLIAIPVIFPIVATFGS
jgi:hypothetical protein